jgi:acetyl-CoA carboxylase carboxyl transferase alpha subunit/acetyl-CoA carboxylase carboxyl transferase beta subunit
VGENPFERKRAILLAYREQRARGRKYAHVGLKLRRLMDPESFTELWQDLETQDPLHFPGYREKLTDNQQRTGARDALMCVKGTIGSFPVVCCELSASFLMGSMGSVVGEKIARAAETADQDRCPLIIISASGGARMQEGMYALFQMEKTAASIRRFQKHGGLFISILTDPTMGGVSASFASLGDVILAEPDALIGFAGPRVIAQTIHQKLPKGFQKAQFQLEHGFADRIARPEKIRDEVLQLLRFHVEGGKALPQKDHSGAECGQQASCQPGAECCQQASGQPSDECGQQASGQPEMVKSTGCGVSHRRRLSAYERVRLVRSEDRPKITDYIDALFTDFTELCGDRCGTEDPAILCGLAFFGSQPVTVIGHRKGKNLRDSLRYNFGMPGPGGYRKALRMMREAEKFGRPVITFIDTPGAYPGKEAEENGISSAIAENLAAMAELRVPILSIVTGEGSSGGALGIGTGDRILMLENAVYSVLSPEGFASILWKDSKRAAEASEIMQMTAPELLERGLIDGIIEEPEGGIQKDPASCYSRMTEAIGSFLSDIGGADADELTERRYQKYRSFEGPLRPACKAAGGAVIKSEKSFSSLQKQESDI